MTNHPLHSPKIYVRVGFTDKREMTKPRLKKDLSIFNGAADDDTGADPRADGGDD